MEFKKYDKIKILGNEENMDIFTNPEDEIVIQEKVDGANFRFFITKEGNVIFGSRSQELGEDKEHKYEKTFQRCIKFIKEKWGKVIDIAPDLSHLIFYGECIVKHTMDYDWEKIPPYLGFDIYDIKAEKYLNYEDVKRIFSTNLNIEMVPLIKLCKAKEITDVNDDFVPKSKYASISSKDQQAEGIVFKNYTKQIMAKYVREKFREKSKKVFGTSKKWAKTDDEYFTAVYCTNARIDKCIFKLMDEGRNLGMEMMGDLLNKVYKDIWEEHWEEIAFSKKKTDLLGFKKLVSRRCLEVLKQAIVNNSLK